MLPYEVNVSSKIKMFIYGLHYKYKWISCMVLPHYFNEEINSRNAFWGRAIESP